MEMLEVTFLSGCAKMMKMRGENMQARTAVPFIMAVSAMMGLRNSGTRDVVK